MSIELKIKSKHLGEEAKIIRYEEKKLKNQSRFLREKFGPERRDQSSGKNWWNCPRTPLGVTLDKLDCIVSHRRWEVRNENRATFLARAFIAGKPYTSVERKVKDLSKRNDYILPRVLTMVQKYAVDGRKLTKDDIRAWFGMV